MTKDNASSIENMLENMINVLSKFLDDIENNCPASYIHPPVYPGVVILPKDCECGSVKHSHYFKGAKTALEDLIFFLNVWLAEREAENEVSTNYLPDYNISM